MKTLHVGFFFPMDFFLVRELEVQAVSSPSQLLETRPYESSSPAEQALALPHPQSHQWEHDLTSQSFHVQPGLPKILLSLSKDLSIEVD